MEFQLASDLDQEQHQYRCYEPQDEGWLELLAAEYVNLRTECNFEIEDIRLDGVEILDAAEVSARLQAATVPVSTGGNFDVVRSDLGEVLGYMILEGVYETSFGYKSVRDRELIQLPGRGIDAVGIEVLDDHLVLCLGEIKVSNQSSPPSVVDTADDGLRNQHLKHLAETESTSRKLWDLGRRCRDSDQQNLFFAAAMLFDDGQFDELDVVACCVLVRPVDKYEETDYGSFRDSPEDFAPARIRFLVIRIPDDVDATVQEFITAIEQVQAA